MTVLNLKFSRIKNCFEGSRPLFMHLLAVLSTLAVVSACASPASTPQPFVTITRTIVSPVDFGDYSLSEYALLPDGKAIHDTHQNLIDLETGAISSPLRGLNFPINIRNLRLSPNGRYLSGYTTQQDPQTKEPVSTGYIFDLETKTYQKGENIAVSWSPDSSLFLNNPFERDTLVSVPENKEATGWSTVVDFRQARNTAGDHNYLWDADQNIPIAITVGKPLQNEQGERAGTDCGLLSISTAPEDQDNLVFKSLLLVPAPNKVVDMLIDPTGRYVLVAIWERSALPAKDREFSADNVTDSVLILVDWRTKASRELLRLSSVDAQHVIASQTLSGIQWSSDGSTILVPRENAGALVLKIAYP